MNIFLSGKPARSPNVLPISQEETSLGSKCTASHVITLRRTPGSCKEAPRQKKIKYPFSLIIVFLRKNRKLNFFQNTKKNNYGKIKEMKYTRNLFTFFILILLLLQGMAQHFRFHKCFGYFASVSYFFFVSGTLGAQ